MLSMDLRIGAMAGIVAVFTTLVIATPAQATSEPPKEGATCVKKDLGREVLIRKVTDRKSLQVSLSIAKSKSTATGVMTCWPNYWPSELEELPASTLGQWIYQPFQATDVSWKPIDWAAAAQKLANERCRLKWVNPEGADLSLKTVGLSYDRNPTPGVGPYLPTDRPVRGLILQTYEPPAPAPTAAQVTAINGQLRQAAATAAAYWSEQSRGRFTISLDIAPGVYPMELGPTGSRQYRLSQYLSVLQNEVNFANYDFVILMDDRVDVAGEFIDLGSQAPTLDGSRISVLGKFSRSGASVARYVFLLGHEIAHAMGFPDYYGRPLENEVSNRFAGNHFLMGTGSQYLSAYERWILGWLPDERVLCVTTPGSGTATISSVDGPDSGPAVVIFPFAEDRAVIVENRTRALPSDVPDGQNLFVYMVNASSKGALRAGTGAEGQNIYSRIGEPSTADRETDEYLYHQAEPPMVTYRQNLATLRRVADAPVNPGEHQAWLQSIGNGALQEAIRRQPYLRPGGANVIANPWFGLSVPAAPREARTAEGNPGLQFTWNWNPSR